jgi:hypothetical protein
MKIGTLDITNCKIGSTQVNEVRIGSTLVWQFASLDPDAQAFLTAAGITDLTITNAINTLVVSLKANGIWTKMKALYPFVGGAAASHKWNLKNPLDTDAAFRLVFNGGWTHSANGALPNGTNAFANTYFIPDTQLTLNSAHISFYSRTNIASGLDIGSGGAGFLGGVYMLNRWASDLRNYTNLHGAGSTIELTGWSRGDGFFTLRRNNSTQIVNSRNGVNNTLSQSSVSKTIQPIWIGAMNNNGAGAFYSARQAAFASIGDGLSDAELNNFTTAVQTFQTALSRNV